MNICLNWFLLKFSWEVGANESKKCSSGIKCFLWTVLPGSAKYFLMKPSDTSIINHAFQNRIWVTLTKWRSFFVCLFVFGGRRRRSQKKLLNHTSHLKRKEKKNLKIILANNHFSSNFKRDSWPEKQAWIYIFYKPGKIVRYRRCYVGQTGNQQNFSVKKIKTSSACVALETIWSYCTLTNIKLRYAHDYQHLIKPPVVFQEHLIAFSLTFFRICLEAGPSA